MGVLRLAWTLMSSFSEDPGLSYDPDVLSLVSHICNVSINIGCIWVAVACCVPVGSAGEEGYIGIMTDKSASANVSQCGWFQVGSVISV